MAQFIGKLNGIKALAIVANAPRRMWLSEKDAAIQMRISEALYGVRPDPYAGLTQPERDTEMKALDSCHACGTIECEGPHACD